MPYLLDTNICIYIIKKRPETVLRKFNSVTPGELALSMITVAELKFAARKSTNVEKKLSAVNRFLLPFELFHFDYEAAIDMQSLEVN